MKKPLDIALIAIGVSVTLMALTFVASRVYKNSAPNFTAATAVPDGSATSVAAPRDSVVPAPAVARPLPAGKTVHQKLQDTIIPLVDFRQVTVREAVDFFQQCSKSLDPARTGVNFRLNVNAGGAVPSGLIPGLELASPVETRITLKLTNVPLIDALKYVVNLANLKFAVSPDGVLITSAE